MARDKLGLFKVGDKIEICRKGLSKKEFFPSQILDVLDDDEFVVSGPIKKIMLVFLHKDEVVTIRRFIENKGRYEFDAIILKRNIGKIYKIKLKRISEIRKIQLRNYFRFPISIPVIKRTKIIEDKEEKTLIEECKTKDISGGGLKLLTNYEHYKGEIIECEFKIKEKTIVSKAEVVRVESVDTFHYKFSIGVRFINMKESDRDAIVKFIFSKQSVLRKKGLI